MRERGCCTCFTERRVRPAEPLPAISVSIVVRELQLQSQGEITEPGRNYRAREKLQSQGEIMR